MADQRQQGVPDPRAAVRVANFERAMDAFNAEQGQKVALSIAVALSRYEEEIAGPRVAALEARIATLEMPRWRRVLERFKAARAERALKRHQRDLSRSAAAWLFVNAKRDIDL